MKFISHASATQRTPLLSGLVLVATYGIGATLATPVQASSFAGFGCIDRPNCQSYLEVYGGGYGISFNNQIEFQNFPIIRTTSPVLWDPTIPDGPRGGLSQPYNQNFYDSNNQLILNLNGFASSQVETVLGYGQLKAYANASTEASYLTDFGISHLFMDSRGWASTRIGWGDTITVTATNKEEGELAPFEVRLDVDRSLSASGEKGGNTQAFVSAGFANLGIFDSNFYPSNVTSVKDVIWLPVGEITPIEAFLEVFVTSEATAYYPDHQLDIDYSFADASNTADYYLTPLDPDVSYTTGSGRTYFVSNNATPVPESSNLLGLGFLAGFGVIQLSRRTRS